MVLHESAVKNVLYSFVQRESQVIEKDQRDKVQLREEATERLSENHF
jgi:hypothetical protein